MTRGSKMLVHRVYINIYMRQFSHSVVSDSLQPHGLQHARILCSSEHAQTDVHQVGHAIQPSHPLSSPLLLPSILPSIRVFSSESALRIRWPKYWRFCFSISPSNEHSGLISLQSKGLSRVSSNSSKASILQCLALWSNSQHP